MEATELKYKVKDTLDMIDIIVNIYDNKDAGNMVELENELVKLTKYPTKVIEEFVRCIDTIKNINQIKDKYLPLVGYITLRLNLVDNE
jgi:hypothetical protein